MYTLWSFCKQRYTADASELKTQAVESMPPEARQSLTEKIVQTLEDDPGNNNNNNNNNNHTHENVEHLLEEVDGDLEQANTQLAALEEKEEFISLRIRKYQTLLKEQDAHLQELHERKPQPTDTTPSCIEEEEHQLQEHHYQEQVQKQQKHKVALGKVVDVHMDILKHVKDCKRTIATLEQKKSELIKVTKQCREFLVMAEEAEREQQLGMVEDDSNEVMEMAPLTIPEDGESSGAGAAPFLVDEEAGESTATKTDNGADAEKSGHLAPPTRKLELPVGEEGMEETPTAIEPEELEASAP